MTNLLQDHLPTWNHVRRVLSVTTLCLFASACQGPVAVNASGDDTDPASMGSAEERAKKPNIVFIVADDLGYGDLGAYGSSRAITPRIDELADSGVRLTQGYVTHPVCSPSRAGFLTGRYQQRFGWEFNPAGRDAQVGLPLAEATLADRMKRAGYVTGMVGKWHLGQTTASHPNQRGFDMYFGILEGGSTYIDTRAPGVETVGQVPEVRRNRVLNGVDEEVIDRYLTDEFTSRAVAFINTFSNLDEPFFLYLSHITPHTPLQAIPEDLVLFEDIEDPAARVYAAMVHSLDRSVGRVVDALEAKGVRDDTLIVFLSDNGCAGYLGAGVCSNGALRGYKRQFFEGGVRVPFIMSWPAELPAGSLYNNAVSSLDVSATASELSGIPHANADGVNLMPYVQGLRNDAPHKHLFWRAGPSFAVRSGPWKLITYDLTPRSIDELDRARRVTPGEDGWDLSSPHGQKTMLYNLDTDVGEATNVADDHPEIVEELTAALRDWNKGLSRNAIMPPVRSTLIEDDGDTLQLFF